MTGPGGGSPYPQRVGGELGGAGHEPTNLGDILERVLDKGIVIAGDIRVNLLDIELLTIKLRLVIASLETAREVGIDWWEHDPWLSGRSTDRRALDADDRRDLEAENEQLRRRIEALEAGGRGAGDPIADSRRPIEVTRAPEDEEPQDEEPQ